MGRDRNLAAQATETALWYHRLPNRTRLRVCFFWTIGGDNFAPQYVTKANQLLDEHNLELDVCPGTARSRVLDWPFVVGTEDDARAVRGLAHTAHPDHNGRLPVIFCRLSTPEPAWTVRSPPTWPLAYVLISSEQRTADWVSLLHEMGHAANRGHVKAEDTDQYRSIMSYAANRNAIHVHEVKAFDRSYVAAR